MCSPQQAPAAEQKAVTELPEWAKPYGKDILAKGAALTDVGQNPYQTYNQDRLAGFSPMQQQAMQNAQGMSAAPQIGQGTAAAVGAGLGGASVAGQANPYGFQNQVGGYMNPYLQMSLAPQLAEANRNYDISGVNQQARATQAGAFGGSREAIMAAENERNRNTGLNSIIGQGYNQAFGQAQNQYNQNLQNQLAGYGLMGSAANSLGQLGQNQYNQNMGINQLQAQYGGQQQAQMQKGLDTSYQDFLNQQNYPYKQLGFMSDLLRGTPTGSSSVTQMYQAPPTALQTVGALGMGAYGINQLTKADGGSVHGYADGGEIKYYAGDQESVTSSDNIAEIISTLNPQQLQAALKNAQARGDRETVTAIVERLDTLSKQASMTQGIAGAMPEQMADGIVNAAGGGILAFQDRGLTPRTELSEGEGDGQTIQIPQYAGDPALYKKFGERAMSSIDAYSNLEAPKALTTQEEDVLDARSMARAKKLAGPSPYAGISSQIDDIKNQSIEALRQGKGLAALAAMEGMLQPGGALRGFGRAGKNFAEAYAPAVRADQDLRKSTALMNINLANAQRAENMGLGKEAMAYTNQAAAARKEAGKAERELALKEAELNIKGATAFRPPSGRGSGAGGANKLQPNDRIAAEISDKIAAIEQKDPKDPQIPLLKKQLEGRLKIISTGKDLGPDKKVIEENKLDVTTQAKAADAWEGKSRKEKKAYAIENGITVGVANPSWVAQAAKIHNQNFGKKTTGGSTVINFDANGQPIQ
jgi:hypothetical protein